VNRRVASHEPLCYTLHSSKGVVRLVIEIPGRGPIQIRHVVFDLNGTLSYDGSVLPDVPALIGQLRQHVQCWLLTGDTYGTGARIAEELGLTIHTIQTGEDKAAMVRRLEGGVAALGNGMNDVLMLRQAELGIAVIGPEGAAASAVQAADIVVPSIQAGLGLLLNPRRIVATLRP